VQLNTVVSGALDRLHYEKDPCVKYDVSRKLWIYRHRSRAEDEFGLYLILFFSIAYLFCFMSHLPIDLELFS